MNRFVIGASYVALVVFLGPSPTLAVDSNVTAKQGLFELLQGMVAHAMSCGEIDNGGDLDIYLGTHCDRPTKDYVGRSGPVANMLLVS